MKPEDVKPVEIGSVGVNYRGNFKYIHDANGNELQHVIPAHEVGAIIKAAMEDAIWLTEHAYEAWHTPEERAKSNAAYSAWLAKAEELEAMK